MQQKNFGVIHSLKTCSSPCSSLFILHAGCLWFFEWKIEEWKERKELFFCKLHKKDGNVFTQIYIYDNNKNISMLIYKKSLKKCLRLFNEIFCNCQANYYEELYLLFEKSGNSSQSEHRDRFDSSPQVSLPDETENSLWNSWQYRVIIESVWHILTLIYIW